MSTDKAMTAVHTTIHNAQRSDILVVGAGPAGIAAAEHLTGHGARVTLIDRHAFPGTKACGGGLTRSAFAPAGIDPSRGNGYADPWREIQVRSPLGHTSIITEHTQMITFDRKHWIAERINHLKDMGARIVLGERFLGLDTATHNVAVTERGSRAFEYLIGADGASSRVRRQIGLNRSSRVRGWQITVPKRVAGPLGFPVTTPVIWFEPYLLSSGYAWSFPYHDALRLGCGASSRVCDAKALKHRFSKWLSKRRLSPDMGAVQAGTIGCDYLGHRFGSIFLAGDAAGLASPLTGEGIYQALASGREVAREILKSNYHSPEISRLACRHRRTHDLLAHPFFPSILYNVAPYLLKWPPLQSATWNRYVY